MIQRPVQLEYAPGAPIRRRKRIGRIVIIILVVGLGLGAWKYHGAVWDRAKLLYFQHQCLSYEAPTDRVVYDEDDNSPSPLLGTTGYQAMPQFSRSPLTSKNATVAVRAAPALEQYAALNGPVMSVKGATVFLHELRTKGGIARLVAVTRIPYEPGPSAYDFALVPLVITPAGMFSQPEIYPVWVGGGPSIEIEGGREPQRLRFFAGQIDATDPAHFTIRYDLMNQGGMIDGRLNEDGTSVSIKIVSGPALHSDWVAGGIGK
jgi:hypothetical protein